MCRRVVHHPFVPFRRRVQRPRLKPGSPASPEDNRLPLLSSEPDGVHGSSPRGAQLSTSRTARQRPPVQDLREEFSLAIADFEYRAPLTPRLARP